jgi:hypothetical protein
MRERRVRVARSRSAVTTAATRATRCASALTASRGAPRLPPRTPPACSRVHVPVSPGCARAPRSLRLRPPPRLRASRARRPAAAAAPHATYAATSTLCALFWRVATRTVIQTVGAGTGTRHERSSPRWAAWPRRRSPSLQSCARPRPRRSSTARTPRRCTIAARCRSSLVSRNTRGQRRRRHLVEHDARRAGEVQPQQRAQVPRDRLALAVVVPSSAWLPDARQAPNVRQFNAQTLNASSTVVTVLAKEPQP